MTAGTESCKGYILVSTIWVLAFLSIGAAAIGEWYSRSLAIAGLGIDNARARADMLSTRSELLYLIATADVGGSGIFLSPEEEEDSGAGARPAPVDPMSGPVRLGVPDIILDGQVYRGRGDTRFAVQDESGLFGLAPSLPMRTRDLLMSRGVEFGDADVLASTLADYADEDDLVRINGAEATDYRFKGMPPPTNRRLESVYELKRVMGWAELDMLWNDEGFIDVVSVAYGGTPNPNLAPREVLERLPGASPELVDGLLTLRRGEGEISDELSAWMESLRSGETANTAQKPSYRMRLRFWREGERQYREYSVKFTPNDREPAPWIFESTQRRALTRDLQSESAQPAQVPAFDL